jgi:hypothetical protein
MARAGVRAVGGAACRGARAFPRAASDKVLKREIVAQAWFGVDRAWFLPGRPPAYRPLTDRDIAEIRAEFHRGGRLHLLEQS